MPDEIFNEDKNLITVFRAPDEYVANIIRAILEGENIPVALESKQVPMYDGVMKMSEGYWGDVVVPAQFADRSRELIEAYQTNTES